MSKLVEIWKKLSPKGKQKTVLSIVGLALVTLSLISYSFTRASPGSPPTPKDQDQRISLNTNMMEKSALMESRKATKEQSGQIELLTKALSDLQKERIEAQKFLNGEHSSLSAKSPENNLPASRAEAFPLQPLPPPQPFSSRENRTEEIQTIPAKEILGEIISVANPFLKGKESNEDKKKDQKTIYLPPSFMKATLLTGIDAETTKGASENPEPVMLRIKDLAVLPNEIKANLKGCFVIANGRGVLSKERVELLLVTLSCLARDGQSVIDQRISGYVADEDGKNGLQGKVVSRMGATVARGALAGLFRGFGDAVQSASQNTSVSPLGVTQNINPDKIGQAALGSGISGGSKELEKIYYDLARQTTPVIEVLPTKNVTLVVTEGVNLIIKEICGSNNRGCE